jgi:hypothetical protein
MDRIEFQRSALPTVAVVSRALENNTVISEAKPSSVGAVSDINFIIPSKGIPGAFSVTLDNSGGMDDKHYMIGDPDGVCAELKGGTIDVADGGTVDPAIMNKLLRLPLSVGQINYEVADSVSQFSKDFRILYGDVDGNLVQVPLAAQVAAARRNTQQNSKLLTLELPQPMVFNDLTGVFLTVRAGETVVLTFVPNGAKGRI